jgi:hypothetical protein
MLRYIQIHFSHLQLYSTCLPTARYLSYEAEDFRVSLTLRNFTSIGAETRGVVVNI